MMTGVLYLCKVYTFKGRLDSPKCFYTFIQEKVFCEKYGEVVTERYIFQHGGDSIRYHLATVKSIQGKYNL